MKWFKKNIFQDSTFSLAGGYGPEELQGSPKRVVRVNAPPGGGMSKGSFWWRHEEISIQTKILTIVFVFNFLCVT